MAPREADGVQWLRDIGDCPERVSLAIVAVPAAAVLEVVDGCASAGVGGLIIATSGFAEAGVDGVRAQAEIVDRAHRGGMRIIGPNCLGVINTAPGISMNATFATRAIMHGHLALGSQSGALGIALLEQTQTLDVGVSSFVSMGNTADVGSHDLLRYWHQDANTRVILLYLEAFHSPTKFFDVARLVTRTKPVVVLKSGRSVVGARAAASHTASLASPDRAADTLFEQAGVIRAATLEEMLALGTLLDHSPVPAGPRVAIISNAGGAGVLAADAADEVRLEVTPLDEHTQRALHEVAPTCAAARNPIDLGSGAGAAAFSGALERLTASGEVDAIVAIHAEVPELDTDEFVALASEVAWRDAVPILAVTLGVQARGHADVARFAFPETAVRALARVVRYGQIRASDPGPVPRFPDIHREAAAHIVGRVLGEDPDGRWLNPMETRQLMEAYGIPLARSAYVRATGPAVAAAREIGLPVALKADVVGVVHKLEAGAIELGLARPTPCARRCAGSGTRSGATCAGSSSSEMSPPGVELIIGAVHDPAFGPLVVYGSGGTNAELFRDQITRLAPLTTRQADDLARAPRGARLLEGFRGGPAADITAVTNVLHRVSQLAADIPEVAELDCNPLIATADGACVVDVRVRLRPVERGLPAWIRTA